MHGRGVTMTQNVNLKEMEKKAFTSYHEDGVLDLCLGIYILLIGISLATDDLLLFILAYFITFSVWTYAKRKITTPRMGFVKFGPGQTSKVKMVTALAVVVTVLCLLTSVVLWYSTATRSSPSWMKILFSEYIMLLTGVIGASLIALGAYVLGITRLYSYAVIAGAVFAAGHVLGVSVFPAAVVVGGVITLGGMIKLIQFVHKYPHSEKEDRNTGSMG